MSRGIGTTQQAILDTLAASEHGNLTVTALAGEIGVSISQARRAARSLEARSRVVITKESLGWKGVGEYGPLMRRHSWTNNYGPEIPTAKTLHEGDPWPWGDGYIASGEVELIHRGMPVVSLLVWLPENRVAYLKNDIDRTSNPGPRAGARPCRPAAPGGGWWPSTSG
jgi:hypothetical protein